MAPAQGWHAKSWSVPHFLCPQNQIIMRKYEIMDGDDPFGVHFPKINNIPSTDYISNDHGFDTTQSQK